MYRNSVLYQVFATRKSGPQISYVHFTVVIERRPASLSYHIAVWQRSVVNTYTDGRPAKQLRTIHPLSGDHLVEIMVIAGRKEGENMCDH
jgi:hypothetical protein